MSKRRRSSQTPAVRKRLAHDANEKLVLIRGGLIQARDETIGAQDFESAARINDAINCLSGLRVYAYRTAARIDRGQR